MTEATSDPLYEATVAERRRLVGLLSELTEEQWAHASLCEQCRVRDVVAHITAAYRHAPETVTAGWQPPGATGTSPAMCSPSATPLEHSDAELLASLADNVAHPWQPPRGGQAGALSHDVIHGLDITEPLELPRTPVKRAGLVLANLDTRGLAYFGVDLTGRRLVASDLDWSIGDGPDTVEAPAADLLLTISGRRPPPHAGEPAR